MFPKASGVFYELTNSVEISYYVYFQARIYKEGLMERAIIPKIQSAVFLYYTQSYIHQVLQTIQMKLIILCV